MLLAQTYNDAASTAAGGVAVIFVMIMWFLFVVVGLAAYLIPTVIAIMRKKQNIAVIVVINILLGWSFVGWVVALVMALSNDQVQQITIVNQQGQNPSTVITPQQPSQNPPTTITPQSSQYTEGSGTSALPDAGSAPPPT